jgi:C1A family cysteine protease
MAAVAQQPVVAAVNAGAQGWMFYQSGVFTGPCPGTPVDHVVLIVGYGSQNGLDYWIVQNSWGSAWGMDGYMYLGRGSE